MAKKNIVLTREDIRAIEKQLAKAKADKAKRIRLQRLNQVKTGIKIVKGVTGSTYVRKTSGFSNPLRFKENMNEEWSDLGIVLGSQFKNVRGPSLVPESGRSRILHPQEKAEISANNAYQAMFGKNDSALFNDLQRKKILKKTEVQENNELL